MDFEREGVGRKEAIEEYKSTYKRISKKIHPDFWIKMGEDVHKEALELFKDLEGIKFTNGWEKDNSKTEYAIRRKIEILEDFEKRVDEFVSRHNPEDNEKESGTADNNSTGGGNGKGADGGGKERRKQDDAHAKRNQWVDDFSHGPSSEKKSSSSDADNQNESVDKEEWLGRFSGFYEGKENREKGANKDGEKSESSGGNEETEKTDAEKRAEKLEKLKQNVELTRAAYARRISEILDKFSVIEKVLYHVKTTPENLAGTTDEYNQYQAALNELLDFQVGSIMSKYDDIPPKNPDMPDAEITPNVGADDEMRELFRYYKNGEKIELYNARTKAKDDIRAKKKDNNELTWKDKIWEKGEKAIAWYRKLPSKQKLAISSSLFAIGLGAGFAGVASVATVAGVARFGQKIVGGAAAGVGAAETQKNLRRMLDERKTKKEEEKMFKVLKEQGIDDVEGRLNSLALVLKGEIRTYDASLKREVRKAGNRKAIGWIVGGAIGASAIVQVVNGLGLNAGQAAKIGIPKTSHLHGGSFIRPETHGGIHNVESGNADNVIYRSMPEALRSGVDEIDNRFGLSGRVAYDFDEYRRITEEMKAVRISSRFMAEGRLLSPAHDLSEFRDLPELRVRLADIDNRLNSSDLDAESPIKDDLIEQKISLESTIKLQEERDIALDGLRERQALCLKKIASGLRKAMFEGDAKISGDPQQIANMSARDYLNDPVAAGRGGKIIGIYQSLMKLPGGEAFAPKSGEKMDAWTRRIIIALMKSKGLKFY